MSSLDWTIVLGVLLFAILVAIYGRLLVKSVSGYLVAERSAGRYLLVISNGMAGMGAITIVAQFEMFFDAGLTANWWMLLTIPVTLIITVSGWVYYRFRQTRAMTLGEFLGNRYSQKLRIFAGGLAFLSGVLNFGIFPSVGSSCLMVLADIPTFFPGTEVPVQPFLMVALVGIATAIVLLGGQIVIILTDLLFGFVTMISMLWLVLYLWLWMDWNELIRILESAPAGESRLDPFSSSGLEGFNVWYFAIGILFSFYAMLTFQGDTPYRAAPLSPHESKMSALLIEWRALSIRLMMMLVPLAAILVLEGSGYESLKQVIQEKLAAIDDPSVARRMTVPAAASAILPIGLKGAFVALILGAFLSTHDTYLHSWASILVRDVILPMRTKPVTGRQEIFLLRIAVVVVAVAILLISIFIQPSDYLLKFMFLSASIFIGGAGALLIGGLYTSWGSSWGAWLGLSSGALTASAGIAGQSLWKTDFYPWLNSNHPNTLSNLQSFFENTTNLVPGIKFSISPEKFPIDGQWWSLLTMLVATSLYIAGSFSQGMIQGWPKKRLQNYFLDRPTDGSEEEVSLGQRIWASLFPNSEYTFWDKCIWLAKILWTGGFCLIAIFGTVAALVWGVSGSWWASFWKIYIQATMVVAVITTIWFMIGSVFDFRKFLVRIQSQASPVSSNTSPPEDS